MLLNRFLYGPAVDMILARTGSGGTGADRVSDLVGEHKLD
jgi:hypothetical protein